MAEAYIGRHHTALTREDLDGIACAEPGCDHKAGNGHSMQVAGRCHPTAGVDALYRDGAIIMICGECGRHVATVKVGTREKIKT